jgi:hypothetical protein
MLVASTIASDFFTSLLACARARVPRIAIDDDEDFVVFIVVADARPSAAVCAAGDRAVANIV